MNNPMLTRIDRWIHDDRGYTGYQTRELMVAIRNELAILYANVEEEKRHNIEISE